MLNFLLLTIDTLRADRLGCYGCPRPLTPNLDRLAAAGVRFTQAITGGTWTQAAFPVILTSTYASMYGGCLGALSPQRPSPVAALAAQGYATAGFATNPHLGQKYGYDRGFGHFQDLAPAESDPWLRSVKGGQALLRHPLTHAILGRLGKRLRPARVYVPAAEVTDHLSAWLEKTRQPFFAWAHYMDVHWPYHLEEELVAPAKIGQAWQDLANYHAANWQGAAITPAHQERYIQLYEAALVYLDGQIGRLLGFLESSGRLANTAVVVVADHGEEFLEHGRWGHWENNLYDEIIRVPLLVYVPGLPGPHSVERQVRTLDVMPTLLELSGCSPPPGMEGASLRPLWTREGKAYPANEAVCEMWRDTWHRIAVRTEKFKMIWDSRQPGRPELYDLAADPAEQQDVSALYADVVRNFQARVTAHLHYVSQTAPAEAVGELELDAAVLQRLRGLGYIE
ncbi:MAG: sulfatase-like hydrolase/transferase [Chloroflexi bacterium]|nr:sulfatase-like hydrolase/transferase [Chloroflexota bacterium]